MVVPQNRVQSGRVATSHHNTKQIVTRTLWQRRADISVSSTAEEVDNSYLAVGTQYFSRSINYRLREFVDQDIVDNFDQYKIRKVQIFATKNDAARNVTLFSSFDPDDAVSQTWKEISRRQNVTTTTLKINEPRKLIASFVPVGNFTNTGAVGNDSPQNVVPSPNCWWDTTATNQSFNSIKIFAAAEDAFSVTFHAKITVDFKGKI